MLSVDNTQKVSDGVGCQSGSDRGEQVESMVSIGQFGVAHGVSAGLAKCAAEGPCLHSRDHRIVLAVQDEKWRRTAVDMRNRRRQFEKFGIVGVALFHDE